MSSKVFILAYTDYETYVPFLLYGPENVTEEEFKALCDSLLEEAGYNSLKEESWIGWNNVVESLIPLLEKQGYRRFNPPKVSYFGPGIIDEFDYRADSLLKGSQNPIIEHNKKVHEELFKKYR